jgi:hypothetical protein
MYRICEKRHNQAEVRVNKENRFCHFSSEKEAP